MVHYLDVMIGFVFTMLVLSLVVTALVQAVPVYLRNLKGLDLKQGLTGLFARIEPKIANEAEQLVDRLLRDSLLSPRRGPLVMKLRGALRLADAAAIPLSGVIQREELVRLLLDLAARADANDDDDSQTKQLALKMLGLATAADAAALLTRIRNRVAALELAHPQWSSSQRASRAMLEAMLDTPGASDFMAKLAGWFDQTIDRVQALFTAHVRAWTVGISAVLVLILHLDSFDLLARLNSDAALRDKVVAAAISGMESGRLDPAAASAAPPADASAEAHDGPGVAGVDDEPLAVEPPIDPPAAPPPAAEGRAQACAHEHLNIDLAASPHLAAYADCMGLGEATQMELISWPKSWADWASHWAVPAGAGLRDRAIATFSHLLGMMLTISLLSLGAPFWYGVLSNLIKLRSSIARKDDAARDERQQRQGA
jgi:hypothetical protein